MHKTLSLILILFMNFGVLSASTDNITSESDMNVFNSGETISSSKMNENFEILKLSKTELVEEVNKLNDNITNLNQELSLLKETNDNLTEIISLLETKLNKVIKFNDLVEELELFVTISSDSIYVSQDGNGWTKISDTRRHNDISFGNDNIYAVGSEDHDGGWKLKLSSSPSGNNWTRAYQDKGQITFNGISYGNGVYVIGGDESSVGGVIFSSSDYSSWISRKRNIPGTVTDLEYLNNRFIALSGLGNILYSENGINWTLKNIGTNDNLDGKITFGNGQYVIVGWYGKIYTSNHLTNWVSRVSGTSEALYGVGFGNNLFVAVGARGFITSSQDGINWTTENSGTSQELRSVVFGKEKFVTTGYGGTTGTSPDGVTWETQYSGVGEDVQLTDLIFTN